MANSAHRLYGHGTTPFMSRATRFLQECPTCGRKTQVRPEYVGTLLRCRHCGGEFLAQQDAGAMDSADDSSVAMLKRVDELLDASHDTQGPPKNPR